MLYILKEKKEDIRHSVFGKKYRLVESKKKKNICQPYFQSCNIISKQKKKKREYWTLSSKNQCSRAQYDSSKTYMCRSAGVFLNEV